jgi:hypothetical protein
MFPKGLQRHLLVAVDFEDAVYPSDLKQIVHSLLEVHKSHFPSSLPDDAVTTDQLAHAIAVDEIHAREIEQEVFVAITGKNMDQVTQPRATVIQCESANRIHDNYAVELSGGDFKCHAWIALRFSRGIIALISVFNNSEV